MTSTTPLVNSTFGDGDLDYDYDYKESWNTFAWEELCPAFVVYALTMVIGIIGNSLIVFTISRYRRMKSTTNVFLASLASADLLLILVCIPVKVQADFNINGYFWLKLEVLLNVLYHLPFFQYCGKLVIFFNIKRAIL